MSKSPRKRRRPGKQQEHAHKPLLPFKPETQKRFLISAVIILLAGIPFAMGKYIEFNSPCAFDGGAYAYSAQRIIDGAKIGVDEKPSAQMGTLLVNILGVGLFGFSDTGPKVIQMILQAAALVLMFITMQRLFGTLPAAIGVIVASAYLSAPLIAKYGNVKEQHMIAFMILGMCCFVLYQLSGKWWGAVLAGACLTFAPMFKETGTSALGAVGLFVIAQPVLKHCSWKKTGGDILLLLAGAVVVISPICLWLAASGSPINYYPYAFLYRPVVKALQSPSTPGTNPPAESEPAQSDVEKPAAKQGLLMRFLPAYVRDSWRIMTPEQARQAKLRVFRWYGVLILPIALAAGAVLFRIIRLIARRVGKAGDAGTLSYDRFVLLFAVWWLFDMTFVWISPRSYEQYYLPLNASAAMLGGYLIAVYCEKVRTAASRPKWMAIGALGLVVMMVMAWPTFGGVAKSPHDGRIYRNRMTGVPERARGYVQRLREIRSGQNRGAWEDAGEYIRENSTPSDVIYVWGWFPGIYVQAQRFSPAPKAFEGTMHTLSPEVLAERVDELLASFEKQPPKFIVDTYKRHFPWDRPPLELWPNIWNGYLLIPNPPRDRKQLSYALLRTFDVQPDDLTDEGFVRPDKTDAVHRYDAAFAKALRERVSSTEVKRFEAMKPFRDFVMNNYRIVRTFGTHVLFRRK